MRNRPSLLHPTHPCYGLEQGGKDPAQTSPCSYRALWTSPQTDPDLAAPPALASHRWPSRAHKHPPDARSRSSCGLAAAYPVLSAHLSCLLSAARKYELKKPKLIPQVSKAGCCYLTASAHSPAQTRDVKAGSFHSAGLSLPRDNFTLRPTWPEPPPCQRCRHVHQHCLAPAQLRRWGWIHLYLWWAAQPRAKHSSSFPSLCGTAPLVVPLEPWGQGEPISPKQTGLCYKHHTNMSIPKPDKEPQHQIKQRSRGGTPIPKCSHLLQSQPKPLMKHQEPPSPQILPRPTSSPASRAPAANTSPTGRGRKRGLGEKAVGDIPQCILP